MFLTTFGTGPAGLDTVRVVNNAIAHDTTALIEQIKALAVVRGKVTLSSGQTADYYIDLRRVTLDGAAAPIVGRVMRSLVADWDFAAVGGLTLGADPVATAMLHAAAAAGGRLDAFVVRKQGKAHGLQQRIEGSPVAGRRVLAVEDTSTTGGFGVDRSRGAARGRGRGDRSRGDRRSQHRRPGGGRGGRAAVPRGDFHIRAGPGVRPLERYRASHPLGLNVG